MAEVTPQDLQGMIEHHLSCPVYGYLGSDYGNDIASLLQQPMGPGIADGVIRKARQDLPVLQKLPAGAVNIYAETAGPDVLNLVFEAGSVAVTINGASSS